MEQLRFSIPEILSLIGLAQCLYVLVYMLSRAGDLKQILLPSAYFLILGTAFFLDFAYGFIAELTVYYPVLQWFFWFLGLPVSVLLVIQIAKIHQLPALPHYWVLFLLPLAYGAGMGMAVRDESCVFPGSCPSLHDWLVITGLIAGAVSMLAIWGQRRLLEDLYREKAGKERYWLVLMLVCVNLFFLTTMLLSLTPFVTEMQAGLIRTFLGLGLVYLAGTSLFRIYPQSLMLVPRMVKEDMSDEELSLARRIERLLDMEKIYQEPAYGRAELARELEVSETIISKVINLHFGKNFPQLLNERRVEDAKQLLRETNASVKVIAEDVGFNSTASFNRVFRDLTGLSPSAYRNEQS